MKKLLIVLAFASVSMATMAQDTEDATKKYSVATNSFWSNWFIQVGAQWDAFYSDIEHDKTMPLASLPHSPLKSFRGSPSASIALGKWFTPGIGVRAKVSGIWGRSVISDDKDINDNKFWIASPQAMFNLSNIFCGYNPNRVWNVIPFGGAFISRSMTYDIYEMGINCGLLNQFRVSRHLAINLEAGWNYGGIDMDGTQGDGAGHASHRGWDSHDNNVYAEVGLTFYLGKATWDKVPDVDAIKALSQSQIDALNSQLNDANAENARLRDMLANQKPVEQPAEQPAAKVIAPTMVSVFFNLDKYNIRNRSDLVNVKSVVDYAKEIGTGLLVTGYADSATGKPAHNQWLSERRAETVANEIVKMGVSRDRIQQASKGGVNDLSPISLNRRVTVQIAD